MARRNLENLIATFVDLRSHAHPFPFYAARTRGDPPHH
jgi:hypothetical protein